MNSDSISQVFEYLNKRDECPTDNDYNGNIGTRISSIFVIMVTSAIGTLLPLLSSKYSFIRLPPMVYFICKYFGSGVIVATAFIHLLEPAADSLGNKCLTGPITEYPWAFGICLMTLFLLFSLNYSPTRVSIGKLPKNHSLIIRGHTHSHFGDASMYVKR